jgi:hypothetical protein
VLRLSSARSQITQSIIHFGNVSQLYRGTALYFEETGLCCHQAKGDSIGFTRSLRIDVRTSAA